MLFYRQKILLALIEVCGGKLLSTDLEKLLFLYCQSSNQSYYDFFPYKYGAFSFLTYYDKQKLIERGYLKDIRHFEINSSVSFMSKLKTEDCIAMRRFVTSTAQLRGNNLIRKTYLDYPEYAAKSEIVRDLLSDDELAQVSSFWNQETKNTLFTIGYEGITIDEYLSRLLFNRINILIDVRKNPFSRKHGFSQKQLKHYIEKAGLQYCHLPELGISSHLRKNLQGKQSYEELFEYYASTILPTQEQPINTIKELLLNHQRVALTCFEAEYQMCHRHKITELFERDFSLDTPIHHL